MEFMNDAFIDREWPNMRSFLQRISSSSSVSASASAFSSSLSSSVSPQLNQNLLLNESNISVDIGKELAQLHSNLFDAISPDGDDFEFRELKSLLFRLNDASNDLPQLEITPKKLDNRLSTEHEYYSPNPTFSDYENNLDEGPPTTSATDSPPKRSSPAKNLRTSDDYVLPEALLQEHLGVRNAGYSAQRNRLKDSQHSPPEGISEECGSRSSPTSGYQTSSQVTTAASSTISSNSASPQNSSTDDAAPVGYDVAPVGNDLAPVDYDMAPVGEDLPPVLTYPPVPLSFANPLYSTPPGIIRTASYSLPDIQASIAMVNSTTPQPPKTSSTTSPLLDERKINALVNPRTPRTNPHLAVARQQQKSSNSNNGKIQVILFCFVFFQC